MPKSGLQDFRRKSTSNLNCIHIILLNISWRTVVFLQDLRPSAVGGPKRTGESPGLVGSVRIHSDILEELNNVFVTIFAILSWGVI